MIILALYNYYFNNFVELKGDAKRYAVYAGECFDINCQSLRTYKNLTAVCLNSLPYLVSKSCQGSCAYAQYEVTFRYLFSIMILHHTALKRSLCKNL